MKPFLLLGLPLVMAIRRSYDIRHLSTPKADSLRNHFGADPSSNAYGPKPELVSHETLFQNEEGLVTKQYIKQLIGGNLQGIKQDCDITRKDWYGACLTLNGCDLCVASVQCSWCELRQTCYPRSLAAQACPGGCQGPLTTDTASCTGSVKAGHLGHWPAGTDHVRTVEYTYPKFKVDTVYTAPQVVRTPMLLGTIQSGQEKEMKDPVSQTVKLDRRLNTVEPIFGEVHQVVGVDVHSTQYVDSQTGQRVDLWGNPNLYYHGVDMPVMINNDNPSLSELDPGRRLSSPEQQKLQLLYARRSVDT